MKTRAQWFFVAVMGAVLLFPAMVPAKHPKVTMCEGPRGKGAEYHTIMVDLKAVQGHLKHGALLGSCPDNCVNLALCPDDTDLCTTDAGVWTPKPKPHGPPEDGKGTCACMHTAVDCSSPDVCHVAGNCDPATGQCPTKPDGTTCDAGSDGRPPLTCEGGTCGECAAQTTGARLVDNGDGTITDRETCLVWEKKDDAGGIHDKDARYGWYASADFLAELNGASFAGHQGWRLPTSAGCCGYPSGEAAEFESLFDASDPACGSGLPCIDPIFNTNCGTNSSGNTGCTLQECSCTTPTGYWSGTTISGIAEDAAWGVDFNGGTLDLREGLGVYRFGKFANSYVRAVRGGL